MKFRGRDSRGLTLIELLVVVGIIGILTGIAIPILARGGFFTSNRVDLAAREYFTILRAARLYATTYNVPTAVAYSGTITSPDPTSEQALIDVGAVVRDSWTSEFVPVVDSMAIVRRLTRKERLAINPSLNEDTYIFVKNRDGIFNKLPNGTCLLPDIFRVDDVGSTVKGLQAIEILDADTGDFFEPRVAYRGNENAFPAHVYTPEGMLDALGDAGPQRITVRVGRLPNAEGVDRFFVQPESVVDDLDKEPITVIFSNPDVNAVENQLEILHDPDRRDVVLGIYPNRPDPNRLDVPIDIDMEVDLYVATGRVKVAS